MVLQKLSENLTNILADDDPIVISLIEIGIHDAFNNFFLPDLVLEYSSKLKVHIYDRAEKTVQATKVNSLLNKKVFEATVSVKFKGFKVDVHNVLNIVYIEKWLENRRTGILPSPEVDICPLEGVVAKTLQSLIFTKI